MTARMPREAGIRCMAVNAELVLFGNRGISIASEGDRRGSFLTTPNPRRMLAGWSMTGLALQLPVTEGGVRIIGNSVLRPENGKRGLVIVTGETGVSTLAAVVRILILSRAVSQEQQHRRSKNECDKSHNSNLLRV